MDLYLNENFSVLFKIVPLKMLLARDVKLFSTANVSFLAKFFQNKTQV